MSNPFEELNAEMDKVIAELQGDDVIAFARIMTHRFYEAFTYLNMFCEARETNDTRKECLVYLVAKDFISRINKESNHE